MANQYEPEEKEIKAILEKELPEGAYVMERGCGERTTRVLLGMLRRGGIDFCECYSSDKEKVRATETRGLYAELVSEEAAFLGRLLAFQNYALDNKKPYALVMFDLPDDLIRKYAEQASIYKVPIVTHLNI